MLEERVGFLEIEYAEAVADALARAFDPKIKPARLRALVEVARHEKFIKFLSHSNSAPQVAALIRDSEEGRD